MLSLLVLWEMTRPWIVDARELKRSFFTGEPYTVLLRPLSIAAVVLTWVFGCLTLWRVRKGQLRFAGRWLAITSMLTPMVLLALLLLVQILPLTLSAMLSGWWPGNMIAVCSSLVAALPLFLGMRGIFRRMRRYATDARVAAPVKSIGATLVLTLLAGLAVWLVSEERGDARWHHHKLYFSMLDYERNPTHPEQLQMLDFGDAELWLNYVRDLHPLERNLFGHPYLGSQGHLKRFDYERVDGEKITCWMPPSRHRIYLSDSRKFRDWYRYLWIHEFELEQGVLKVEYEFPVRRDRNPQTRNPEDTEMLVKKEERIRTKYGVEPDTVCRAEIRVQDLKQYTQYGMDKEFWQSAERVEER